jgi:peptide/nickel transport system substrate-binding protein/oligopeptide transport system substrate-binding protein
VRVRSVTAAATTLAVLLVTGCGIGASQPEPGTVSIGITEPGTLLPSQTGDDNGAQVLAALFTPLVGYDTDRRPVPLAAASVTSADNRTWRITLADGFTFHDGTPVTADHYLTAWNWTAYGPHRQRNAFLLERVAGFADVQGATPRAQTLAGLKKVDDRTFDVTLTSAFADFAALLGHPAFLPLPPSAFASPGALRPEYGRAPVGQGPFRMIGSWEPGTPIRVERVTSAEGKARRLEFRVYPGSAAAYEDLRAGNLDVDVAIPETELAGARELLGDRLTVVPTGTVSFLAVPAFEPDYADARVRRAVSMAIDRDALIKEFFPGSEQPAHSFVPPTVPGFRPDSCGRSCSFDPAAARQAYADAGGPARLQITYNSDGGHEGWVTGVCAQLTRNLGVPCAGAPQPRFDVLLGRVRRLEPVGMFRMTWTPDYPSMESHLTPLFSSAGSSNYTSYRNTDFDSLVRRAGAAKDPAAATPLYQEAESMLARDLPVIPLRYGQRVVGHSARTGGVVLDAFERLDVGQLTIAP